MRNFLLLALPLLLAGCATMEGVTSFTNAKDTGNLVESESRLWHEAAGFDTTIEGSAQIYKHRRATA